MTYRPDESKPPSFKPPLIEQMPPDQLQLLQSIDDCNTTIWRLEDKVSEREAALTEVENDLHYARNHKKQLEKQLNDLREAAADAAREKLSVYGSLPGIPDSAIEPGDYLP